MRSPARYLTLAAMAMAAGSAFAQEPAYPIPTITITPTTNGIEIAGSVIGLSPARVTGKITIDRRGRSGTVKTSQSRELDLAPGKIAIIARSSLSFDAGDVLDVLVTVERDGKIVGRATTQTTGD